MAQEGQLGNFVCIPNFSSMCLIYSIDNCWFLDGSKMHEDIPTSEARACNSKEEA